MSNLPFHFYSLLLTSDFSFVIFPSSFVTLIPLYLLALFQNCVIGKNGIGDMSITIKSGVYLILLETASSNLVQKSLYLK